MGAGGANPNAGVLEGMSCPECGDFGPFKIAVSTWARVGDDGSAEHEGDTEWDDTGTCICLECHHTGTVLTFSEEGRDERQADKTSEESALEPR